MLNPIIPGFSPDPSLVLVDDTYYLVNSTFHIFPGLPVYESKDLVNWRHITNAFNRREQLTLINANTVHSPIEEWGEVMSAQGGLYAPTIRYHDGTFYVVCTNVIRAQDANGTESRQNFIITTDDIHSDKWNDPIFFDFDGIDTSLVWDDEGRAYLHGSGGPGPMTKIKLFEIDVKTGKKLTEEKLIWEGTGGIWPEGPHIYRKDDWWYLMISEGGTFEDHMITVARSKELFGPYEPNPKNPILTARGTDEYIQHTGHCEMFCDKNGQWWCVCLAVRKDPKNRYLMGRETFITPGTWPEGQWPTLERVKMDPDAAHGTKLGNTASLTTVPMADFCYIRDVNLADHKISDNGKRIELVTSKADFSSAREEVSFVGKRQRVLDGHSSVKFDLKACTGTGKSGLAIYKDEFRFARTYIDLAQSEIVHEVFNKSKNISRTSRKSFSPSSGVTLMLEYKEDSYVFSFDSSNDKSSFDAFDTLDLVGPDFVGPIIGVFSTDGEGSAAFLNLAVW